MQTIKVVIGANAGDEGKGLATDYFANQARNNRKSCTVVLSNGGSQRGHTVTLPNGTSHVFRHFGSGSFVGAITYIPKQYILNPMNYALEVNELGYVPRCYIHPECLVSTPFDIVANQIIEDSRGDKRHGSCGVGIWETILRNGMNINQMINLYFQGEDYPRDFKRYLKYLRDGYFMERLVSKDAKVNEDWRMILFDNGDRLIEHYCRDFETIWKTADFSARIPHTDWVIFEGGQGLLLDQDIVGYGHNTTPSNTGLKNAAEMIRGIDGEKDVEVCYVTRTYMTRHGAGRFDTEWDKLNFVDNTNHTHPYQGALRFGELDVDSMIRRCVDDFKSYAEYDWKMSFMVTHMNERSIDLGKFTGFQLYTSDGLTRESIERR